MAGLHGCLENSTPSVFPGQRPRGLKTFYDYIVPAAVDKLAKSWDAKTSEAHFITTSRNFVVKKTEEEENWVVFKRDSGQIVSEIFPDQKKAEAFCRSREVPVIETINALYIHEEMRADLQKYGLPYLGAVGKRQTHPKN